ncbi:sigma-70 family RNA polymerase sigma factor [Vibrio parahaemolyticus]|nr:sigma-70 family RNA polymerase sigma factor [Vibrio parahaemolyticus]EJG0961938.1 sigma-70 family RNA polymerase sigma factor [Vibrio parahaemolyticus]
MNRVIKCPPLYRESPIAEIFYLNQIEKYRLLTKEEEFFYVRRAQKGDKIAREQMINSHLRLIVNIAKPYQGRGVPLLELIEKGQLGLEQAIETFDPEKKERFSSYASHWVRQNIVHELTKHVS